MSVTEADRVTKIVLRGRKVVGGCAEGEALVTRKNQWNVFVVQFSGAYIQTRDSE